MKLRVKMFAVARQLAGTAAADVEIAAGGTVADLRAALARQFPDLGATLDGVVFAVNAEYAPDQTVLSPDDEVACIPPVSGGA